MALTRQQKLLCAIVALGIVAVALDRLVISQSTTQPHSAAAADAVSASQGEASQSSLDAEALLDSAPAELDSPSLSKMLERVAAEHNVSHSAPADAFTPPEAWVPRTPPEPRSEPDQNDGTAPDNTDAITTADRFVKRHRLVAVMVDHGAGLAIVDGQAVRVGETLDGFTLRRVAQRKAVFEKGATSVELELEAQP